MLKAKRPSTKVSQSRVQDAWPLGSHPDAVAHRKDALNTSFGAIVKMMRPTTNRISTRTMPPAKTTRACLWYAHAATPPTMYSTMLMIVAAKKSSAPEAWTAPCAAKSHGRSPHMQTSSHVPSRPTEYSSLNTPQ